jgi:hypothetical protein
LGDFNVRSGLFEKLRKNLANANKKGEEFEDFLTVNKLTCKNTYDEPTFVNHNGSSVIDLVVVSGDMVNKVSEIKLEINFITSHRSFVFHISVKHSTFNNSKTENRVTNYTKLNRMITTEKLAEYKSIIFLSVMMF